MKEHIWNCVVNIKVLNKPEFVLYFILFKVATFCFDDSFAHSWRSHIQIREVVTWNGFQTFYLVVFSQSHLWVVSLTGLNVCC